MPTVHLADDHGRVLRRWAARHPGARVALRPVGVVREPRAVARWSSPGSPLVGVLKPDLVAPAAGVLGAVPGPEGWDFVTGTSAAAAYTAGAAATLLRAHRMAGHHGAVGAGHHRGAPAGDVLHSGAGRLRPDAAVRPGLVYEIDRDDYRAWLVGPAAPAEHPVGPARRRPAARPPDDHQHRGPRRSTSPPAPSASGGTCSVTPAAVRLGAG